MRVSARFLARLSAISTGRGQFPHLTDTEIANFKAAVDALDALAIRMNCYHARLELSLFEGPFDPERVIRIHKDVYAKDSSYDPSYPDLLSFSSAVRA